MGTGFNGNYDDERYGERKVGSEDKKAEGDGFGKTRPRRDCGRAIYGWAKVELFFFGFCFTQLDLFFGSNGNLRSSTPPVRWEKTRKFGSRKGGCKGSKGRSLPSFLSFTRGRVTSYYYLSSFPSHIYSLSPSQIQHILRGPPEEPSIVPYAGENI